MKNYQHNMTAIYFSKYALWLKKIIKNLFGVRNGKYCGENENEN